MKNYVAIYNTDTMKNVHYAFMAESMEAAIEKAPKLVSGDDIKVFETDDMGQIIYNTNSEVADYLELKYSKIKDFEAYAQGDNLVTGGFYKTRYGKGPDTEYFLRETFGRIDKDKPTFNDLFKYLDNQVQRNLKVQKRFDEAYAKEHNKKVAYQFDYSLIEEA